MLSQPWVVNSWNSDWAGPDGVLKHEFISDSIEIGYVPSGQQINSLKSKTWSNPRGFGSKTCIPHILLKGSILQNV